MQTIEEDQILLERNDRIVSRGFSWISIIKFYIFQMKDTATGSVRPIVMQGRHVDAKRKDENWENEQDLMINYEMSWGSMGDDYN